MGTYPYHLLSVTVRSACFYLFSFYEVNMVIKTLCANKKETNNLSKKRKILENIVYVTKT